MPKLLANVNAKGVNLKDLKLDLDRYIPFGLAAIANKVSRGASRVYLDLFGIGINEWRILANLKITPGMSANAICASSGLDKAAVSRSLRELEDARLIEPCGEQGEIRGRQLKLTPKGVALHDKVIHVALERERRLLSGFSEAERRQLHEFITRMHKNVPLVNESDYRTA